jgi:hypothetical protein
MVLKSSVGLFWRYLSLPAATLHLFHLKRIEGPAAEIHYGSIKGQHLKGFRFLLDKIEDFASHWKDLEEGRIPVILSPLFPHQALTLLGQFPLTEPQLQDLGASTGGINWKALARGLLKNEGIRLLIDYSRAGVDWVGEDFLYAWDVLNLLQRRRVLEHISRGFLKHPEAKKLFWQRMNRDQMYNSDYTSPELSRVAGGTPPSHLPGSLEPPEPRGRSGDLAGPQLRAKNGFRAPTGLLEDPSGFSGQLGSGGGNSPVAPAVVSFFISL